jgi:hypothetical protein
MTANHNVLKVVHMAIKIHQNYEIKKVLEMKHTIYQHMFHIVKRYNKNQFMKTTNRICPRFKLAASR